MSSNDHNINVTITRLVNQLRDRPTTTQQATTLQVVKQEPASPATPGTPLESWVDLSDSAGGDNWGPRLSPTDLLDNAGNDALDQSDRGGLAGNDVDETCSADKGQAAVDAKSDQPEAGTSRGTKRPSPTEDNPPVKRSLLQSALLQPLQHVPTAFSVPASQQSADTSLQNQPTSVNQQLPSTVVTTVSTSDCSSGLPFVSGAGIPATAYPGGGSHIVTVSLEPLLDPIVGSIGYKGPYWVLLHLAALQKIYEGLELHTLCDFFRDHSVRMSAVEGHVVIRRPGATGERLQRRVREFIASLERGLLRRVEIDIL